MDSFQPNRRKYFKSLGENNKTPLQSVKQPSKMEQNPLSSHLKYAYLGTASTLPVIILASLIEIEEDKLLRVLRDHKNALGWSLADLKGIRPSMCMHRILLEDGHKPSVEEQRKLYPTMSSSPKTKQATPLFKAMRLSQASLELSSSRWVFGSREN